MANISPAINISIASHIYLQPSTSGSFHHQFIIDTRLDLGLTHNILAFIRSAKHGV
jgi:hypothetical protein